MTNVTDASSDSRTKAQGAEADCLMRGSTLEDTPCLSGLSILENPGEPHQLFPMGSPIRLRDSHALYTASQAQQTSCRCPDA